MWQEIEKGLGREKIFFATIFLLTNLKNKTIKRFFRRGPLTQSVEYLPFKQRVAGSSPARPIIARPHRLAWSRTPAFHAGNRGSNPLGDAIFVNKGLR